MWGVMLAGKIAGAAARSLSPRLWLAVAVAFALCAAGLWIDASAYARGEAAVELRMADEVRVLELRIRTAADRARVAEEARLQAERVINDLRTEMDEQGRADPDADRRALGAGGVLRVDSIRRAD